MADGRVLTFKRLGPSEVAKAQAEGFTIAGGHYYADGEPSILVVREEDPSRMGDAICLALLAFGVGCLVVLAMWAL